MDIDVLDQAVIRELASVDHQHCLTLMMPAHPTGADSRQDPIRLKNLIDRAEGELRERDLKKTEIDRILKQARRLADSTDFWRHQGRGLALFISPDTTRAIRLPREVDERVHVGPHFLLKPLFASAGSAHTYHAILISKKRARLMRGSQYEIEEIEDDRFPVTVEEVAGIRDGQDQMQRENTLNPSPAIGQRGGATFHGHGIVEGRRQSDLEHFASEVARRADAIIGTTGVVLIVGDVQMAAMIDERFPRHGNGTIVRKIVVSPDGISDQDLQQRCWEACDEATREDLSQLLDRFGTAAAESKAVEGVERLAIPAAQGRVDTLILDARYEQFGALSPDLTEVHVGAGNGNGAAEDLVNRSVIDTVLNSGRVVPLETDGDSAPVPPKAILRY